MRSLKDLWVILSICYTVAVGAQDPFLDAIIVPDSIVEYSLIELKRLSKNYSSDMNQLSDYQDCKYSVVTKALLHKYLQINDSLNIASIYVDLSRMRGDDISYLNKAIKELGSNSNSSFPAIIFLDMFRFYFNKGEYRKALVSLNKARNALKNNSNDLYMNFVDESTALLNLAWGDGKTGKKFILKLISSTKERLKSADNAAILKDEIASFYYSLAQYEYHLDNIVISEMYLDSMYSYQKDLEPKVSKKRYAGLKGAIEYKRKNYKLALEYTNYFLKNESTHNEYSLSTSNLMKGLILWKLDRKIESLVYLKKSDSLYQITRDENKDFRYGYEILIDYYKNQKDFKNQIKYLNRSILFNEELNKNYLDISTGITKNYTIPNLMAEKEVAIQNLTATNRKTANQKSVYFGMLLIASLIISYLIVIKARQKRKIRRLLAHQQKKAADTNACSIKNNSISTWDAPLVNLMASGLEKFEKEQLYLDPSVTLKSAATFINSNQSYLSKYVNTIKGVNFKTYLNDLRIHFILDQLFENSKFRNYTVQALAEECGFTTAKSFANNFKRYTKVNVSYYLENLEKYKRTGLVDAIPQTT